jgi:hypothetical protein
MSYRKFAILLILLGMIGCCGVSSEAMTLESLIPKEGVPEGWVLVDGPHLYTKKALFEHINGQAEIFFKYGFQKSIFAIYQNKKKQENQIELDIYDMGNILQAFGIFSRFRNEDRPAGIGLDSYLDNHSALFCKGKYFVMLYSTESDPSTLKEWAAKIALKIVDASPPPKEMSYFPKNGLKGGSIEYFPEGLLGHQFLKRGFKGTYTEKIKVEVEDKGVQLFIAIFNDSHEAMSALKVYQDDLSKKGKASSGSITKFETRALKGEDPGQGKVIVVHKGSYLVGVVGFEKEEYAENLLAEFIKNIR